MRPESIIGFELAVFVSLALGVINALLTWYWFSTSDMGTGVGLGLGIMIIASQVPWIVLYLLLVWFIARRASLVAMWIYVVLTALSLSYGVYALSQSIGLSDDASPYLTISLVFMIAQMLLALLSLWLLSRPDARRWFRREGDDGPRTFR